MITGKQYMEGIKIIRRRIKLLNEQIERDTILAAGVGAIQYDKDRVQTTPISDRMANIVIKITETTEKLEREIHNLQLSEEEAIGYLLQLKEEHERVLSYHYLDGFSWGEINEIMHYADKYIYEIRDRALDELTQVLTKSYEI